MDHGGRWIRQVSGHHVAASPLPGGAAWSPDGTPARVRRAVRSARDRTGHVLRRRQRTGPRHDQRHPALRRAAARRSRPAFQGPAEGPLRVLDRVSVVTARRRGRDLHAVGRSCRRPVHRHLGLATGGGRIVVSIGAHGVSGKLGQSGVQPGWHSDRVSTPTTTYGRSGPTRHHHLALLQQTPMPCGGSSSGRSAGDSQIAFAPSGTQVALVRTDGQQERDRAGRP